MPHDQQITKEERAALKARLAEATVNLEAYVARLHTEVTTPGTEVMMVADEPFSPDPAEGADTLTSVAETKAAERLADQAHIAKRKLDAQADTAAELLTAQAKELADAVAGLRDAVRNLEHRTVITEERASMSTERANLIEKTGGGRRGPFTAVVVGELVLAAAVVWLYFQMAPVLWG
jgi:hypothetical protein